MIDRLAQHALRERLLSATLAGADAATLDALARAGGELPAGVVGAATWGAAQAELLAFAERLRTAQRVAGPPRPTEAHTLALVVDGRSWRLRGDIAPHADGSLLRWRIGRLRAADRLTAWLWHLWRHAMHAIEPLGGGPAPGPTRWIALDQTLTLRPAADAVALLGDLLRLYADGLGAPLRFYPKSAWEYCGGGIVAARTEWTPTERKPHAEGADTAYRLALRGLGDPLDERFEVTARRVFSPLIEHLA